MKNACDDDVDDGGKINMYTKLQEQQQPEQQQLVCISHKCSVPIAIAIAFAICCSTIQAL